MARIFYFYKSGQIILSLLCIIFLSAVNELCRTEKEVDLPKSYVKRAAAFGMDVQELNTTFDATVMDEGENATDALINAAAVIDPTISSSLMNATPPSMFINDTPSLSIKDAPSLLFANHTRTAPSLFIKNYTTQSPLFFIDTQTTLSLSINDPGLPSISNSTPSSLLFDNSQAFPSLFINESRLPPLAPIVDPRLPPLFIENSTVPQPSFFINDSRTSVYRTYCISIPFFDTGFLDPINGESGPAGTYPVYAQKLSSRFVPIILLFTFIAYCLIRMLCLYARPYSNNASRHRRCCCQCSTYVHAFFALFLLGLGFTPLLYAHHNWNNIHDWPHIDAIVDFPALWLFAEALFLVLMLTVAIELGLRDCLYAVIKLDRSKCGYHLPLGQADSTILSHHSSINPLQPRNYFDDAQQEANEMEMTITEMANLHRCYGSRRSATVAGPPPKSTFSQPSDVVANESCSSNNTYSNCACSTFTPANAV